MSRPGAGKASGVERVEALLGALAEEVRAKEVAGERQPEDPFVVSAEEALVLGLSLMVLAVAVQEPHPHVEAPALGGWPLELRHISFNSLRSNKGRNVDLDEGGGEEGDDGDGDGDYGAEGQGKR